MQTMAGFFRGAALGSALGGSSAYAEQARANCEHSAVKGTSRQRRSGITYHQTATLLVQAGDGLEACAVYRWLAQLHMGAGDELAAAEAYLEGFRLTESAMSPPQLIAGLNNLVDRDMFVFSTWA